MPYLPQSRVLPTWQRRLDQMVSQMEPVEAPADADRDVQRFDQHIASMPDPVTVDAQQQSDALDRIGAQGHASLGQCFQQPDQGLASEPSQDLDVASTDFRTRVTPGQQALEAQQFGAASADPSAFHAPVPIQPERRMRPEYADVLNPASQARTGSATGLSEALGAGIGTAVPGVGAQTGAEVGRFLAPVVDPLVGTAAARVLPTVGTMSQVPQQAALGGISGNLPSTMEKELRGREVLEQAGVPEGPAREVGGAVLEQVVDPLNYLPIGLGGKAQSAARGLERAIADGASEEVIAAARSAASREAAKRLAVEGVGSAVAGGTLSAGGESVGEAVGGDTGKAIGGGLGAMLGGGLGATAGADLLERGAGRLGRSISLEQRPALGIARGAGDVAMSTREPSPLIQQLAREERVNPTEVLNRADEITFISPQEALQAL
jgi:hypothetical protein